MMLSYSLETAILPSLPLDGDCCGRIAALARRRVLCALVRALFHILGISELVDQWLFLRQHAFSRDVSLRHDAFC